MPAVEDAADRRAREARLDRLADIVGVQAVAGDRGAVQHEAHERDVHLLLEREVDDARHPADGLAHALAEPPQRGEIVAEHLDGDVGPRARQHVVDPVRDRLTDRHVGAGQRREPAAQIGEQLGARPAGVPQADVDFRRLDALDVLVELGAAGPAGGGDDFGLRQQDLFDAPADLVRLRERRAGQRVRLNGEAAFVELGQERGAHARHRRHRRPASSASDSRHRPCPDGRARAAGPREPRLERPRQPPVVPASESIARRAETRSTAPA